MQIISTILLKILYLKITDMIMLTKTAMMIGKGCLISPVIMPSTININTGMPKI